MTYPAAHGSSGYAISHNVVAAPTKSVYADLSPLKVHNIGPYGHFNFWSMWVAFWLPKWGVD